MPEVRIVAHHTFRSHGARVAKSHMYDWMILVVLGAISAILNIIEPFHRFISEPMMTDVSFPFHEDAIPMWAVPIYAVILPVVIFFAFYLKRKDVYDLHHSILGLLHSVLITLVITDAIKDAVGRPRPNFFWRCFPDGIGIYDHIYGNVMCTGDKRIIKEGYKSFPSGHSSVSFAGLGFLSWYLAGKIKVFDRRGHNAKVCIVMFPLLFAALVAASRVGDYWHHWQDVLCGSLIGLVIASICYLQSFPYPNQDDGWAPHIYHIMMAAEQSDGATRSAPNARRSDVEDPDTFAALKIQMRRFRRRRRYRRLGSVVIAEEHAGGGGRGNVKLWRIRVTPKLRLKVTTSSMAFLRRLRNAYVGIMLGFASRVAQLNSY